MGRRQVVRHGTLIPAYPGSNPGAPAISDSLIHDLQANSAKQKALPNKSGKALILLVLPVGLEPTTKGL